MPEDLPKPEKSIQEIEREQMAGLKAKYKILQFTFGLYYAILSDARQVEHLRSTVIVMELVL